MYKKVDTSLNFVEREKEIIAFWKSNDVFGESIRKNIGGKQIPKVAPKSAKVGRNDPCPCGSGKKYKDCCYWKDHK